LEIRDLFIKKIIATFPSLSLEQVSSLVSENLLSPFKVELPRSILVQAQDFVSAIFRLRESNEYKSYLATSNPAFAESGIQDPGNKAICMSYDFHLAQDGTLKLIEINTNASFLLLGDLMYSAHGVNRPIINFSPEELIQNVKEELVFFGKNTTKPRVAIIDDNPAEQKLFLEFLCFAELFKNVGWETRILDYKENLNGFDFIYNRLTDFYFTQKESQHLKDLFKKKKTCFSPNPYEYFLLADKARMIDWSAEGFLENMNLNSENIHAIKKNLLSVKTMSQKNKEEIWANRKGLFFKPQQSFGAKQSYRGAKISRKVFEEICNDNFIAQEFVEAPELELNTPQGDQAFKYDLRFYAYKGRVQSVVARLYQGQVTNLKTPFGGFGCVEFN
jgi:hypothetical protein